MGGVAAPVQVALSAPAASGVGIVTTEAVVPAEADIAMLRHWVTTVRGAEA